MKKTLIALFAAILAFSATLAPAQQKLTNNVKDMPASKPAPAAQAKHAATGTVTKLDAGAGIVTLAHGPVKSLNWPSMTMGFKVNDKLLFDKLGVGKTVDFQFVQADKGYVITGAK